MPLKWANADKTAIFLESDDGPDMYLEPYGDFKDMFVAAASGSLGTVQSYSPPPAPSHSDVLASKRRGMVATRLQARLALGPDTCAKLHAMADDETLPWAMRQTLKFAQEWNRTHPTMDEIGWLLGYTPDDIDDLFIKAMSL